MRTALPGMMIALLSASCGGSPESAGEQLANQRCACDEARMETGIKAVKDLYDELKGGHIASKREFAEKMQEMQRVVAEQDKACEDEGDAMQAKFDEEFMRDDDRNTILNAKRVHIEKCKAEVEERRKDYQKEAIDLQQEFERLAAELPM